MIAENLKTPILPSEIITYKDPLTGSRVRQLTAFKGHSYHFYFTNSGWWDGGKRLLFGSDRMGRTNLFSVHLESGEITQHTDSDMPGPPKETSFQFAAVHPARPECYFWRGRDVMAVNLLTNEERRLWESPDGYLFGILNVTADGRYLCTAIFEDLSSKFSVDLLRGYVGFEQVSAARPHSKILKIDIDQAQAETVWEENYWIGHVNTSPTQPHLVSFCHEGPWDKVDNRIWMLDLRDGRVWPVRQRITPDEVIGHEYWYADGVTLGYHGHRADAGSFFGVVRYDDTGSSDFTQEGGSLHFHSQDDRLIVGDGGSLISLWTKGLNGYGKSVALCRHDGSSKIQQLHVHPCFSPDGKKIVFTSDRTGYGQLYEVEVTNPSLQPAHFAH